MQDAHKERLAALGKALRAQRKRRGITQEELAASLGMSPATISFLENGKKPSLTLRDLYGICEALGARASHVLEVVELACAIK